jgi:hypothetical protein
MTGRKADRRIEWFFGRPYQSGFNEKGPGVSRALVFRPDFSADFLSAFVPFVG